MLLSHLMTDSVQQVGALCAIGSEARSTAQLDWIRQEILQAGGRLIRALSSICGLGHSTAG